MTIEVKAEICTKKSPEFEEIKEKATASVNHDEALAKNTIGTIDDEDNGEETNI